MDMDELTRYVFRNYSSLLTPLEADGFRRILDDTMDRVRAESDLPAEHMIELEIRRWVYASVFSGRIEVSMDALRFMERVRDRVPRLGCVGTATTTGTKPRRAARRPIRSSADEWLALSLEGRTIEEVNG
jgi:hypothetical protein